MTQFYDSIDIGDAQVRETGDGYLVADVRVARTGVQDYLGSELGKPEVPIIRVYRPEAEVFDRAALQSYAYRPVTSGHKGTITAANWKDHSAGMTGAEVVRDGDFVRVPMTLMDAAAIGEYKRGKRQLSMGYSANIEFKDGVTPSGESYNAVLTDMRMNHLALVDLARGGDKLRIGDNGGVPQPKTPPIPNGGHPMPAETRQVVVDGLTIDVTPQGAEVIAKLQRQIGDAATAQARADASHSAALADSAAKLAKAEAERDAAQAKVLNDAAIDKLVADRADLLATAKAIHDADYTGKSPAEIKRSVVVAKIGDAAIAGKPDAYVEARFDILADAAKLDPVARALNDGAQRQTTVADKGYAASVAALENRWKTPLAAA